MSEKKQVPKSIAGSKAAKPDRIRRLGDELRKNLLKRKAGAGADAPRDGKPDEKR